MRRRLTDLPVVGLALESVGAVLSGLVEQLQGHVGRRTVRVRTKTSMDSRHIADLSICSARPRRHCVHACLHAPVAVQHGVHHVPLGVELEGLGVLHERHLVLTVTERGIASVLAPEDDDRHGQAQQERKMKTCNSRQQLGHVAAALSSSVCRVGC